MIDGNRKMIQQLLNGPDSTVGVSREAPTDSDCRETTIIVKLLASSKKPYPSGDGFQQGLCPSMTFTSGKKF